MAVKHFPEDFRQIANSLNKKGYKIRVRNKTIRCFSHSKVNLPHVELGAFRRMTAVRYERELCGYAETLRYHAERVAGSGRGNRSVCDVVLVKDGQGYLVEVKSTKNDAYYVSDKPETRQRLQDLINVSEKCGATPLLAVRFKRRGKRRRWVIKKLEENLSRVNPQEETLF